MATTGVFVGIGNFLMFFFFFLLNYLLNSLNKICFVVTLVPIEMPQRRTSRTSSNTTLDGLGSTALGLEESASNFAGIFDDDANTNDNIDLTKETTTNIKNQKSDGSKSIIAAAINLENGSDDSFQSAKDNIVENNIETNAADNQFPALRLLSSSPLHFEQDTNNEFEQLQQQQTNGNGCNNESSKHMNTINTMDDISMNLFLEGKHFGLIIFVLLATRVSILIYF